MQQVLWATKGRFNIPDSMQCLAPQYVYRYLGIDQLFEMDDNLVKDHVTCEYRKRLHKIWKSQTEKGLLIADQILTRSFTSVL